MPNTLHTPAETVKDFDPLRMKRANAEEVFAMYRRLWGYAMPEDVHLEYVMQGEHLLDETQE